VHFVEEGTIALPGRGLSLAWSPDGGRIAAGGRFRDATSDLRYDTRIADVVAHSLVKSFACHYFYVVATAWTMNPFLGEILADGGGDHAVKLWNPLAAGSATCKPGQFLVAEGAVRALGQINGWTTALAFSPDGRYLAGASRDRMIRIWQLAPGRRQFRVVGVLYDQDAGNFASVVWRQDGRGLVTGDRRGHVTAWDVDPDVDAFDDSTVDAFAALSYEAQPGWCQEHAAVATRPPRWRDTRRGWMWNVRMAPDGERVAAGGADGDVTVYDVDSGSVVVRSSAAGGSEIHGLDWSPDGSLLAAGARDHAVYLLEADTGGLYDRLEGHADVVSAVSWSPDGHTLATTAGGPRISLALLDVATGPDQTLRLWVRR
jgi:WD40 repeat protein